MEETYKCPFGDVRCLCRTCIRNAAYEHCEDGYCINCFECEQAGEQVHDIWCCTGCENLVLEESP